MQIVSLQVYRCGEAYRFNETKQTSSGNSAACLDMLKLLPAALPNFFDVLIVLGIQFHTHHNRIGFWIILEPATIECYRCLLLPRRRHPVYRLHLSVDAAQL